MSEKAMKRSLFVLGLLLATAVTAQPARAQNYPWCARYGTPYDDTSCGFTSYRAVPGKRQRHRRLL